MINPNHSNQCQYFYIRAWAKFRNTNQEELNWLLEKAQVTLAPWDAVYRHPHGIWQTFSNMRNEETKNKVQIIYSMLLRDWFEKGKQFRSPSSDMVDSQNTMSTM